MKQARRCSRERRPKRTKSGERAPTNTCRGRSRWRALKGTVISLLPKMVTACHPTHAEASVALCACLENLSEAVRRRVTGKHGTEHTSVTLLRTEKKISRFFTSISEDLFVNDCIHTLRRLIHTAEFRNCGKSVHRRMCRSSYAMWNKTQFSKYVESGNQKRLLKRNLHYHILVR